MEIKEKETDFTVAGDGSLFLVAANNDPAREHLKENVDSEAQWFGGRLVVEHRYIANLVSGLQENGFTVN